MARNQLDEQYGRDDIFDHHIPSKVQHSMFNLGRKNTTTTDVGLIHPMDVIETVPGDYFEINWRYLIDTLPLAVPPYNKYRVRFHAYYDRYLDLWEGSSTYFTKGRSGSLSLQKPTAPLTFGKLDSFKSYNNISALNVCYYSPHGDTSANHGVCLTSPMSLPCLMGLPITTYCSDPTAPQYIPYEGPGIVRQEGSLNPTNVNLLPFFMYQKIYRRFYAPANLLSFGSSGNKIWYPDDLTYPWRISYNKDNLGGYYNHIYFADSPHPDFDALDSFSVPSISDTGIFIFANRYATFGDDVFTTALPQQIRGSAPSMQQPINIPEQLLPIVSQGSSNPDTLVNIQSAYSTNNGSLKYSDLWVNRSGSSGSSERTANITSDNPLLESRTELRVNPDKLGSFLSSYSSSNLAAKLSSQTAGSSSFNLNQLRQLIALSVWQERNTRTNGNYNSLIEAHFGDDPHYADFEPRYLGGSSDDLNFTQVVQTSESSGDSPLGTVAALGHSDRTSDIIRFRAPDYGYIMILMIIMPDIQYKSGIEKLWTRIDQEDEYFPEYNALGFQAVLNKQVHASGNQSTDDDVFGWQERNLEFKTRQSIATGMMALPPVDSSGNPTDLMFSSYIQARDFSDGTPKLSSQFVTASPNNLNRNWLSYPNYPAFKVDFAVNINARRSLPYQSAPETFGF